MVPLYAARIEDVGPGDFVKVECAACGHDELIPASALLQGLRLPPTYRVLDLAPGFAAASAIRAGRQSCRSSGERRQHD
jgi:hypothetical protein